jgi:transcriptional regulator with XRE-family HTH domain
MAKIDALLCGTASLMFAVMPTVVSRPRQQRRAVATGRERADRRVMGVNLVRYRLLMGKDHERPTFPEWLAAAIEARYDSDSAFARAAGVSPSVVSRWVKGELTPTPRALQKIAPALGVNATTLSAIAYPELGGELPESSYQQPRPVHPIARDIDRLLGDESPVPEAERATLAGLLEAVVSPYRRYLRKRRTA